VVREIQCPRCHTKTRWENNPYRPFCSLRCKMIDLGAWIKEEYVIKGEEKEEVALEEKANE
jgi:uncharacterized protein